MSLPSWGIGGWVFRRLVLCGFAINEAIPINHIYTDLYLFEHLTSFVLFTGVMSTTSKPSKLSLNKSKKFKNSELKKSIEQKNVNAIKYINVLHYSNKRQVKYWKNQSY